MALFKPSWKRILNSSTSAIVIHEDCWIVDGWIHVFRCASWNSSTNLSVALLSLIPVISQTSIRFSYEPAWLTTWKSIHQSLPSFPSQTFLSPSESSSRSDLRWRVSTLTSMQLAEKLACPSDLPIVGLQSLGVQTLPQSPLTPPRLGSRITWCITPSIGFFDIGFSDQIEGVDRHLISQSIFKLSTATVLSSKFGMLTCWPHVSWDIWYETFTRLSWRGSGLANHLTGGK